MDQITVHSPASVSNVVCGFDCLGFALYEPYDIITVKKRSDRKTSINNLNAPELPTDPSSNVAGVAVMAMLDAIEADFGLEIEITKGIKPGSGIGSSAASSCGAVFALNELLDGHFSKFELVRFALEGEYLASGSRHADNAAPCIYGGFTLVRSAEPLDIVPVRFPQLYATVVHPQIEIKTSESRALLPKEVDLADAVKYWSNLGAFVAALNTGDLDLMARSMEDRMIEPARKPLIPKYDEVKAVSLEAGAIGVGISGSGPSMFALSETEMTANEISAAINNVFADSNIDFAVYVSLISPIGVRVAEN